MRSVHAVIMAGGSGTRFWPASRTDRPKQLLPLAHGEVMLRAAVDRLAGTCPPENVWIVTNATQRPGVEAALPDFPRENVLIEPEPRNTAPCIGFATAKIAARAPQALVVVLPADQVIEPLDAVAAMLQRGLAIAADGRTLVTFGVAPTFAATGFGYVELGERLPRGDAFAVASFREKPDAQTAQRFVDDGAFWWNSGIFVFAIDAMKAAMQQCEPTLRAATDAMQAALTDGDDDAFAAAFRAAPKTSIDFAVMEKAPQIAVVECTARWHDVGSFPALADVTDGDGDGNHVSAHDGGSAVTLDARGNVVYVEGQRTVALFGAEDLVVCAVGDAVLVCPKHKATDLKALISHLRATGRADLL